MSVSIVQGGPVPDFLAPWVYDYISAAMEGVTIDPEKVVNQQSREPINRIKYIYCLGYILVIYMLCVIGL